MLRDVSLLGPTPAAIVETKGLAVLRGGLRV
jgi:hypothetical protein